MSQRAQRTSWTMACFSCQAPPPIQARHPRLKSHPRNAKPAHRQAIVHSENRRRMHARQCCPSEVVGKGWASPALSTQRSQQSDYAMPVWQALHLPNKFTMASGRGEPPEGGTGQGQGRRVGSRGACWAVGGEALAGWRGPQARLRSNLQPTAHLPTAPQPISVPSRP